VEETLKREGARLISDLVESRLDIVERKGGNTLRVRGEFAKADVATENKRKYPRGLWEKNIERLRPRMEELKVYGELDHPCDGKTALSRTSHLVTGLELDDKGLVYGEAIILNTDSGRNLRAIIEGGGKVGVSSRGYGSTKPDKEGNDVVGEDYRLVTFDFVAEPADSSAYPDIYFEGVEMDGGQESMEKQEEQEEQEKQEDMNAIEEVIEEKVGEVIEEKVEELSDALLTDIVDLKSSLRAEILEELSLDPELAGSKRVLDDIKALVLPLVHPSDFEAVLEERDHKIRSLRAKLRGCAKKRVELEEENYRLAAVAKEVGYKLFLERFVSGDPNAELICNIVGDVNRFETSAELKECIVATQIRLQEQQEKDEQQEQKFVVEKEEMRAVVDKMTSALEDALAANQELALELYIEKKLTHNPHASKIKEILEGMNLTSKADVDRVVSAYREPKKDSEQLEQVRTRVRRMTGGGSADFESLDHANENRPVKKYTEDFNGLGTSLSELRKLAGVTR
jgi:hypothetical protein